MAEILLNDKSRKPKTAPNRGDFTSRLLTIDLASQYVNRGKTRTRQFCDKIGATVILGPRCVRFDRLIIDAYLDKLSQAAVMDENVYTNGNNPYLPRRRCSKE